MISEEMDKQTNSILTGVYFIILVTAVGFALGILCWVFGIIREPVHILSITFGSLLAGGYMSVEYGAVEKMRKRFGLPDTFSSYLVVLVLGYIILAAVILAFLSII